jgi:hypothetical protein
MWASAAMSGYLAIVGIEHFRLKESDHAHLPHACVRLGAARYMSNYGKYQKHLCDMPFLHQAPPGSGWIWTIRSEMAGCK